MTFLSTVLWFVVTLGLLITVHELGHYAVARLAGVKILRFSLGFGRPLLKVVRGRDRTEWVVGALPLGGYVRMLDERDTSDGPVPEAERSRAFNRQPVGRRIAIVLAGPLANLLLAVGVYWGLNVAGSEEPRAVLAPPAAGTPAARAGLQEGDAVVAVGGREVLSWSQLRWQVLGQSAAQGALTIAVVDLEGRRREVQLDVELLAGGEIDQDLFERLGLTQGGGAPVVRGIAPGGAAERAGFRVGDRIRQVGDTATPTARAVSLAVRAAPGATLIMQVERNGERIDLEVIPAAVDDGGRRIGRIGVDFLERIEVRYGVAEGFGLALQKVWDTTRFSLRMLARMITGEASWRNLSGPVTIADYAGQTARVGLVPWLGFLALVSISLGVLNLLPIPMLDGGHLLYYAIEIARGSPPPDRWVEAGHRLGFALLVLLTALAIFNDLARLLS